MGLEVAIASTNGARFTGYLATPTAEMAAGLVIIQEIFGVNRVMRQIADAYAAAGYLAIVPDLFWRQEPGIELDVENEANWAKAFELYKGFDEDNGVTDLMATLGYLRQLNNCTGKVGTVGFCLGGKLAYLMATRSDTECNVGYYGVAIENNLAESGKIENPLMLHIAENDEYVPPEAQETVKTGLSDNPLVTIYSYPGASHGFARAGSASYVPDAGDLANRRTMEFLKQYLS